MALTNSAEVFNSIKQNEFVKVLGVVDHDDRIDVDKLYAELKKQAQKLR